MNHSALQKARYTYAPKLPKILGGDVRKIGAKLGGATESVSDHAELSAIFPKTYGMPTVEFVGGENPKAADRRVVGVILSGGPAAGGHNVIAGLFDGLTAGNPDSRLIGFLGGPSGIIENRFREITREMVDSHRNTGGFDMIGSGRTKLETEEQFEKALATCRTHGIGGIIIIGGDDSNTNAAILAEYFRQKGEPITVVGVPKTIDGDLKNAQIATSFGFDTATKTYGELIGNVERDAASSRKYWHFIKLMGRSASHIALECALQTRPNVALISEEIERDRMTLAQIAEQIAAVVAARAAKGDNFGVVLVPEGLVEFVPEMKRLIEELNNLLAGKEGEFGALTGAAEKRSWVAAKLSKESGSAFASLPASIQSQLLADRDPHGNVQVSRIETEKLLSEMVDAKLAEMAKAGRFKGAFSALHHFFGYEGRCAFPSNFDSDYCYALGYTAFLLLASGRSGYMSAIGKLHRPATDWVPGGIPITMMMNLERRHGSVKPVIRKALVDLAGMPFATFANARAEWGISTSYRYPGAIQYFGPAEVCDQPTMTLALESEGR